MKLKTSRNIVRVRFVRVRVESVRVRVSSVRVRVRYVRVRATSTSVVLNNSHSIYKLKHCLTVTLTLIL